VRVQTREPFNGVVYARDRPDTCAVVGQNRRSTIMRVPLSALEQCGVIYNQVLKDGYGSRTY